MESHKKLNLIIMGVSALGAIIAVVAYIEQRDARKLKTDVLALEKNIKELELHERISNYVKSNP